MKIKTDYFMKALNIVSWIIFVGVCIEAGTFIVNAFITLILQPEDPDKFWMVVNLTELYNYNQSYFITLSSLVIIVAVLRALMFYFIVEIFHDKKLDLSQPFNETIKQFILKIAYLAMGIGMFSFWGAECTNWLVNEGIKMPEIQHLRIGGADVWLFMGVTLLVIAQIFKKGIELQNENDLTV